MRGKCICWLVLLVLSVCLPGIKVTAQAKPAKHNVEISFVNVVDGRPLQLNDGVYRNAHDDTFSVTMYKYYISNLQLLDGETVKYTEPESYHLINEGKPGSKTFILKDVPDGNYSQLRFVIGVDSLHNVSGAQSGALDPINAMFWDWNTGYIMAKIEGLTTKKTDNDIAYHLGGFAGKNSVLRTVTLLLPKIQDENNVHKLRVRSDVAEWFKTPNEIDFSKMPVVTTEGKEATTIADNYADMFTVDHAE